jgi:hypothetical protein
MPKTDREQVLEFMVNSPLDEVEAKQISDVIKKNLVQVNATLSPMVQLGYLERTSPGNYRITDKGRASIGVGAAPGASSALEDDPSEPMRPESFIEDAEAPPSLPSEYDKFVDIGSTLGLKRDFNKIIADTVFTGDAHNLAWVWTTLQGMFLRPDVTKRWFNLWKTVVNQPVPPEIMKEISPAGSLESQRANEQVGTGKWTIINNEILPDPEGEYTFGQARQVLATNMIAKANPSLSGDSVSSIIAAITPLLGGNSGPSASDDIQKTIVTTLLSHALEVKPVTPPTNPPMGPMEMIQLINAISELKKPPNGVEPPKKSVFEDMRENMDFMRQMRELFSPPAQQSQGNGVSIPISGMDGKVIGAVPIETLFTIQDHNRKVAKEDEEFASKQETSKTIRQFLGSLADATQKFSSRQTNE